MWFKKKAAKIVGPLSPEVQQQLNLEEELNQIRQQSQKLKKDSDDMLSVLDYNRTKSGDLLKRVNLLSEQIETLEHYVDAYNKVTTSGGEIDLIKWGEYLAAINPEYSSLPKDMNVLMEATKRELPNLYSQRDVPLKELQERHSEMGAQAYTLITELNGFQKELKRNIFKDSKGFFAGVATVSPELASNLLNDVNLNEEDRRDLELTISKSISGELPIAFEVEVSILRDALRNLEDTILNQEKFVENATTALNKLKSSNPEESAEESQALENSIKSISSELSELTDKYKVTKEKMIKLEGLYDKHVMQPLKEYIDTIAVAALKALPEGTSKEIKDLLMEIIKKGLTTEIEAGSPTSLTPEDVQKMVTYAEKKGKLQNKFLVPLVVDHYVVGKLHEDIPELKNFKTELPEYYADDTNVENSLHGWVFDIGNFARGLYSMKEAIRQLYLSNYTTAGEDILNSKLKDSFAGKVEGLSKPEISTFNKLKEYVGPQTKLKSILLKINEDIGIEPYFKAISVPNYEGFQAIKKLAEDIAKKKTISKELLKEVNSLVKDVNSITDPEDPEIQSVMGSIDALNGYLTKELGSANTLEISGLDASTFLEYKDAILDWLDSLVSQLGSLVKPLEKHLNELKLYVDQSDYKDLSNDLESLMYAYATGGTTKDGDKVINQINSNVDKIASILDGKIKTLSDELKAFGIDLEDNTPEDFVLSLLHKNESARGPRGLKETMAPSGLVKKQELSKERIMKYGINEIVNIKNSAGLYRIVAVEKDSIAVVSEDDLRSGISAVAEIVNEGDISKPLAVKPELGDKIVDEVYGDCTVINASKENAIDIMLSSGVKIFDYPLHKLAASEETIVNTNVAHQCFLDGSWSIGECCSFVQKDASGNAACGYREAVQKSKELKKLADAAEAITDKEEKKELEILKIAKVLEFTAFESMSSLLNVKSKINVIDPIFTPIVVGSQVYNRNLTRIGNVTRIDPDTSVAYVQWSDGNTSKHWQQELINVEAKTLVKCPTI